MFIRLPVELGLGREFVGRMDRTMYGTRDAGAIWEETYTSCLLQMGFTQGSSSPCTFFHRELGIALVVHGDDFTALGTDAALDVYEKHIASFFEVERRGRLGLEDADCNEMKILNRIVRVTPHGFAYEADPRHVDIMTETLGLEHSRAVGTPGANGPDDLTTADNALDHEYQAGFEGSFERIMPPQMQPRWRQRPKNVS